MRLELFRDQINPRRKPVSAKQLQGVYTIRDGVASEIRKMIQVGILEEAVQVDWVSLIVIAKK